MVAAVTRRQPASPDPRITGAVTLACGALILGTVVRLSDGDGGHPLAAGLLTGTIVVGLMGLMVLGLAMVLPARPRFQGLRWGLLGLGLYCFAVTGLALGVAVSTGGSGLAIMAGFCAILAPLLGVGLLVTWHNLDAGLPAGGGGSSGGGSSGPPPWVGTAARAARPLTRARMLVHGMVCALVGGGVLLLFLVVVPASSGRHPHPLGWAVYQWALAGGVALVIVNGLVLLWSGRTPAAYLRACDSWFRAISRMVLVASVYWWGVGVLMLGVALTGRGSPLAFTAGRLAVVGAFFGVLGLVGRHRLADRVPSLAPPAGGLAQPQAQASGR
ncbi:MAG TPA: hypothetical protein VLJ59_05505 [Mycobacteriales bacterium]|nr:hypothetical protein [Mycobacteriales bacterium]